MAPVVLLAGFVVRPYLDNPRDPAVNAAAVLGRKYHFDEAHARHVAVLATSLFDQLSPLHELPAENRKILQAAPDVRVIAVTVLSDDPFPN